MIGVLTYDHPHRKTYDLLCALKTFGYHDVIIFVKPWEEKKSFKPLYEHRPKNIIGDPDAVARNFNYNVAELNDKTEAYCDLYLIGGAGILGEPWTTCGKVINAHPGYLPNVRGLDALKWAIYEGQPIGVTTHIINKEPDAGELIEREIVPVYPNDTFHALAQRVYEKEIELLIDSIELFRHGVHPLNDLIAGERWGELHMRMPRQAEIHLLNRFQRLVEKASYESD